MLGWYSTRKWWFAFDCGFGFYFIGALGLWILLIVSASFIILLSILMACNSRLHCLLQPVLDVIQTMPSFVYLIPVLMLFGIGKVPALFATVIYATAQLIRLTALGIRQVNPQIIEAARSFGTTNRQKLSRIDMAKIRFQNISKVYRKQCNNALKLLKQNVSSREIFQQTGCQVGLCNINLEIDGNSIFCIIDLSGSGKSTLISHINRLTEPSCGDIWDGETNVMALDQNVSYVLKVKNVSSKERLEQAKFWLNEVWLAGYKHSCPDRLSGGMRQRVGVARSIAANTDIILMDELFPH